MGDESFEDETHPHGTYFTRPHSRRIVTQQSPSELMNASSLVSHRLSARRCLVPLSRLSVSAVSGARRISLRSRTVLLARLVRGASSARETCRQADANPELRGEAFDPAKQHFQV